jgi:ubiquinone/menaquinone biosynthesis C-methylase UbiE
MSRDSHRAVQREYGRLAERYDDRWASYVDASVRETLRRLPPNGDGRLLDIGCGTGAFLEAVRARYPDMRIAGVDISPHMLAVARRRLPKSAALHVAPADALPFPDARFDVVVTTNAFHFFRTPDAALREIHRVLRPGGIFVVTDWCDDYLTCRLCDRLLGLFTAAHHRTYGSAECRRLLERAGFEAIAVEPYKISWLWGLMTATAHKRA